MSPAYDLVDHVWRYSQTATGKSYLKLNHAMQDALRLAIRSGMSFDASDLASIYNKFSGGYWLTPNTQENCYRDAVIYRNASAWKAFEAWLGRVPFIIPGASVSVHTGDGPCGQGLARIVTGAEFKWWRGERVTVTSFNDKTKSFTACSYTRTESTPCPRCERCWSCGDRSEDKLLHRYTITHADIKAARNAAKSGSGVPE